MTFRSAVKFEYSNHCLSRIIERDISIEFIETAIKTGKIINEYPNDKPYPSFLILAFVNKKPIHVLMAYYRKICIVITAYWPNETQWENDFKTKIMDCVICKTGTTQKGKVTVTMDIKGTVVVIRDVPAKVCKNCGNYYLSSETSKLIMARVQQAVKKGVEIEVMKLNAA